jgi:hypothetical protein
VGLGAVAVRHEAARPRRIPEGPGYRGRAARRRRRGRPPGVGRHGVKVAPRVAGLRPWTAAADRNRTTAAAAASGSGATRARPSRPAAARPSGRDRGRGPASETAVRHRAVRDTPVQGPADHASIRGARTIIRGRAAISSRHGVPVRRHGLLARPRVVHVAVPGEPEMNPSTGRPSAAVARRVVRRPSAAVARRVVLGPSAALGPSDTDAPGDMSAREATTVRSGSIARRRGHSVGLQVASRGRGRRASRRARRGRKVPTPRQRSSRGQPSLTPSSWGRTRSSWPGAARSKRHSRRGGRPVACS